MHPNPAGPAVASHPKPYAGSGFSTASSGCGSKPGAGVRHGPGFGLMLPALLGNMTVPTNPGAAAETVERK